MAGTKRGPTAWLPALCLAGLIGSAPIQADTSIGELEPEADAEDRIAYGEYVLRAGGCVTCHTAEDGEFLAGGRPIESPFGVFYGPNITPDPEHGIGGWSEDDFKRALQQGRGPDGRHYYPAFPFTSYTRMKDEDIEALWAFLQAEVEPVARENTPHDLVWYARFRPSLMGWKWLHFEPGAFEPDPDESEPWNRGAYLTLALGHCMECHTPRTRTGGLDLERLGAGARLPDGDVASNITPDRETGIGRWGERHIARYLEMGLTRDGDFAGGAMADVIDHGTAHLTDEDRRAIAVYLQSLEPLEHEPE
ncbi:MULTISPECIES: cytochrome c [unclassified Thioalkalivibrio]|uniref:cytochrome c n=1 Tax=unclassified Thioalkalivibrio TaxID=2621013 RepID=UPI00036F233D|nr:MULTISPECIES: cytochrome c [unclassified Thioalkalivibrio]